MNKKIALLLLGGILVLSFGTILIITKGKGVDMVKTDSQTNTQQSQIETPTPTPLPSSIIMPLTESGFNPSIVSLKTNGILTISNGMKKEVDIIILDTDGKEFATFKILASTNKNTPIFQKSGGYSVKVKGSSIIGTVQVAD